MIIVYGYIPNKSMLYVRQNPENPISEEDLLKTFGEYVGDTVTADQISALSINDKAIATRFIKEQDQVELEWTGDNITGVTFLDDARNKFTVELDKSQMLVGEQVTLTITVFEPDGVTPKTNENRSFVSVFDHNGEKIQYALSFNNGVAVKTFTINTPGSFTFGEHRRGNFVLRGNMPTVEVYVDTVIG